MRSGVILEAAPQDLVEGVSVLRVHWYLRATLSAFA